MAGRVLTDSDPCNPCTVVRETSAWVLQRASQVSINDSELLRFAAEYSEERVSSLRKEVEWDACDWHYKDADTDLTAQYIFVMDSLNYCFWPVEGMHISFNLPPFIMKSLEATNRPNPTLSA